MTERDSSTNIAHCTSTSVSRQIVIHFVPQFLKVQCKKDICMRKRQKDMCPFSYWSVVNVIKVRRQDICMGQSQKDMCHFSYWSVVNVIKVRRQDICMGQSQKDMCAFSYWRAREGNSEWTGKFHQSPEIKKTKKSYL